ncbi:putative BBS5 protein [Blattamonas nauphoetae]|uniref:BBS5 protein n=1 Tax=Blattamonas nauphoetae TaxID=2049346 RepID=A0ABQ9Y5Z9_9EUKA|nr:putative BBS5 protein [Blattamonas nauphoetae]
MSESIKDLLKTHFFPDREASFDLDKNRIRLQNGEEEVDYIPQIEDVKGGSGDRGALRVTNLRLIWLSSDDASTNISIGYNCVKDLFIRNANSAIKGKTRSLYVVVKIRNDKFEFIFSNFGKASPRLFTTVQTIVRAYETSRTYRDLRLRCSIIHEGNLRLLKGETIISKVGNVWNISNSQGHVGTMHTTNIRAVWHANNMPNFNVSIPYIQISDIYHRDSSKFGPALVIQTAGPSGSFSLGFRVEPIDQLRTLTVEIQKMIRIFYERPIFGVEYIIEEGAEPKGLSQLKAEAQEPVEESFDIQKEDPADVMAMYYAETLQQRDRPPTYDSSLGLAVEILPQGFTIDKIWNDLCDTAQLVSEQLLKENKDFEGFQSH